MDRYARVIEFVLSQPWAITVDKAHVIVDFLRLRAAGLTLTDQEIQARVGAARERPSDRKEGAIAVVPVFGTIAHRMNLMTEISGGTSTEKLMAQIQQLAADPSITAIVLDVDSPGGGVFGVPELAEEIRSMRGKKPIVAVANALMASAAYWIGSAASELVAIPSAQVGSIGVFSLHEDWSKNLDKDGIAVSLISAGKYKTEGNPFEPLSADAREAIQREVDHYYGLFTKAVAKGRDVEVETVQAGFGEGRVVNAKTALKLGMIDRIATLEDVIGALASGDYAPQRTAAAAAEIKIEAPRLALSEPHEDAVMPEEDSAPAAAVVASAAGGLSDVDYRRLRLRLLDLG